MFTAPHKKAEVEVCRNGFRGYINNWKCLKICNKRECFKKHRILMSLFMVRKDVFNRNIEFI
jgi:hypothetical protein